MFTEIALEPKINASQTPIEPVVLTDSKKTEPEPESKSKKGFLSTFAILFAGWLIGNLILLSALSLGAIILAGSTGLVKVPFLTNYFFGDEKLDQIALDSYSLHNGEEKIEKIQELSNGETIKTLVFYEDEINALLAKKAIENKAFPIRWEGVQLKENSFVFKGRVKETNAPVEIEGQVNIQKLGGEIKITKAVYGKVKIPNFIAASLVESHFGTIGISLSGNQIPARALKVSEGILKLFDVSKTQTQAD